MSMTENEKKLHRGIGAAIKTCEEYESLPKIHGWVARDGDDKKRLCLFTEPPVRFEDMWLPEEDRIYLFLDNSLFPEITWESEPVEVELLIRKV